MEKYLTKEAYQKVKEELRYLETTKRKEVAEQIRRAASFGDLSENAAYDDAKEAKSFLEGKIDQLRDLLKSAQIIDKDESNKVSIGSRVGVETEGRRFGLEIVSPAEADPLLSRVSYESPLGKALLGKEPGQIVQVKTAAGVVKYKIVKIG